MSHDKEHRHSELRMIPLNRIEVLNPRERNSRVFVSFSEDGCAKCQKPNALQQQRGLNPSGNDGRQAARSGRSRSLLAATQCPSANARVFS